MVVHLTENTLLPKAHGLSSRIGKQSISVISLGQKV